ncbi:DUF4920 domain-containing protein [Polaribacter batillariae]|uniref:DUF4920 domain-containing protein n=1 Tax=Polaribacter batillariae TaxID=2808900 RepID=A0ABX7SYJ5_9FLAO|nr:DUF4920 domain-containing protein [Polaribacter batillariae]QTD39302.1 DUF4920 domain-containing protein [Polaribacter batillariae]
MKVIVKFCAIVALVFTACKDGKKDHKTLENTTEEMAYATFGDKISEKDAFTKDQMLAKFENMNVGDTIDVKFTSEIKEVCSKKGCWMKLPLNEETETMVRFKDYGFFMPLDSQGKQVIVEGKAFVKITPVEELQHYAQDAGKSKEEIAKITKPKKEFAFEAKGVLLGKK